MRMKRLIAAGGVTAVLLVLMPLFEAHAGIWCPTPIPGVLMRYCLCESITGRAEVSSPTPLSPLTVFGLWRDLNATAMVDWVGRVQAREGKRRFLSHRRLLACDRARLYDDQDGSGRLCCLQICLLRKGQTGAMRSALLLRSDLLQLLVRV